MCTLQLFFLHRLGRGFISWCACKYVIKGAVPEQMTCECRSARTWRSGARRATQGSWTASRPRYRAPTRSCRAGWRRRSPRSRPRRPPASSRRRPPRSPRSMPSTRALRRCSHTCTSPHAPITAHIAHLVSTTWATICMHAEADIPQAED